MDPVEKIIIEVQALKLQQDQPPEKLTECVADEQLCEIFLNGKTVATLACSPMNLRELALGYLVSEGIVGRIDSVTGPAWRDDRYAVQIQAQALLGEDKLAERVVTSGCAGGLSFAQLQGQPVPAEPLLGMYVTVSRAEMLSLARQLAGQAKAFQQTGGVHSAALCEPGRIVFQVEDIGRHNAVDKVIGWAKLNGVELQDKLLLSTGRISADIVLKAARAELTIIASRGAPTSRALAYAEQLGLTVVGFVRGRRMTVYTWPNRCRESRPEF